MAYPRSLSRIEQDLLLWLLPVGSAGYTPYREFVTISHAIGEGRWGEGNILLDTKDSSIDRTLGMPPVIAYGECDANGVRLSISVHDFNIDDQLEVQFSGVFPLSDAAVIENKWCYSYWKPGEPCPATGTLLREVVIQDVQHTVRYVLAISLAKRVIWLHHANSGFNQLVPLTSFYDELLRAKHIRDAKLISKPATFFDHIGDFTDSDFIRALLEYDKKASRKFDAAGIMSETEPAKKSIFQKLFGK